MTLPFKKMNGLGNDFVVIDGRDQKVSMTPDLAARIADRATGIGCDQLIVVEKGEAPADAFMRIFNRDGGEVDACGNASRCVGQWLMEEKATDKVTLETNAGLLRVFPAESGVTVDMGAPKFDWEDIPLSERMDTRNVDVKLGPIEAPVLMGPAAVNVGNPHAIFFVDDVNAYDLEKFGPLVEFHPLFPEQTNVELAQIINESHIRLRVWERGVGITQACGTGACATAAAAARKNLTGRRVTITLDGGDLEIEWREANNRIYMTGPTSLDYEGTIPDSLLGGAA